VALPAAVEYLFPNIRLGTLWNVLDSDVDIGFILIGVGATILVTWVNYLGIRAAALLQAVITSIIICTGILLVSGAIAFGEATNAQPWIATPVSGILIVLIMVPSMLIGFDVIPQSAEEINLPPNKIGRLLVFSLACAVAWYVLIAMAVSFGLTAEAMSGSTMATADAATSLWGSPWAGSLLVLGGIGGILTSWNAFVVGASRVLFALAKSGHVPSIFATIHAKYKTPYVGILAIGLVTMVGPLFGRTILVWLVNSGSFAVTIAFVFVAISFLVLREKEPNMPRPFKVSHPNLVGYGGVIMSLGLLSAFFPWSASALAWPQEWMTILIWSLLGAVLLKRYERNQPS
jgi:amino acid transporter